MEKVPETYGQAVAYIEDVPRFTRKHTLEHTGEFLRRLGSPQDGEKIIHVAGTNGKGSVCAYLRAILNAEGYTTGWLLSPHLVKINERIQINGEPVDDETFYQAFRKVYTVVKEMEDIGIEHPSYFEFLFGMGMVVFAQRKVDYVILETGMGGRLDATNAVQHPILTVITSISLDHTEYLGDTIEEVAAEKAGILKENVPVIYDDSDPAASAVIREKAESLGIPYTAVSEDSVTICEVTRNEVAFFRGNGYDKKRIWHLPVCGIYQAVNAEIAIEAAEEVLKGTKIQEDRWERALRTLVWEGRMEEVMPHLFVDGGHNPGAIRSFIRTMNRLAVDEESEPPVILFSAVQDKAYPEMIRELTAHLDAKAYIITGIKDVRGVPVEELAEIFRADTKKEVRVEEDIKDAIKTAFALRGDGEIYCLGSLYLAGEVKAFVGGD